MGSNKTFTEKFTFFYTNLIELSLDENCTKLSKYLVTMSHHHRFNRPFFHACTGWTVSHKSSPKIVTHLLDLKQFFLLDRMPFLTSNPPPSIPDLGLAHNLLDCRPWGGVSNSRKFMCQSVENGTCDNCCY